MSDINKLLYEKLSEKRSSVYWLIGVIIYMNVLNQLFLYPINKWLYFGIVAILLGAFGLVIDTTVKITIENFKKEKTDLIQLQALSFDNITNKVNLLEEKMVQENNTVNDLIDSSMVELSKKISDNISDTNYKMDEQYQKMNLSIQEAKDQQLESESNLKLLIDDNIKDLSNQLNENSKLYSEKSEYFEKTLQELHDDIDHYIKDLNQSSMDQVNQLYEKIQILSTDIKNVLEEKIDIQIEQQQSSFKDIIEAINEFEKNNNNILSAQSDEILSYKDQILSNQGLFQQDIEQSLSDYYNTAIGIIKTASEDNNHIITDLKTEMINTLHDVKETQTEQLVNLTNNINQKNSNLFALITNHAESLSKTQTQMLNNILQGNTSIATLVQEEIDALANRQQEIKDVIHELNLSLTDQQQIVLKDTIEALNIFENNSKDILISQSDKMDSYQDQMINNQALTQKAIKQEISDYHNATANIINIESEEKSHIIESVKTDMINALSDVKEAQMEHYELIKSEGVENAKKITDDIANGNEKLINLTDNINQKNNEILASIENKSSSLNEIKTLINQSEEGIKSDIHNMNNTMTSKQDQYMENISYLNEHIDKENNVLKTSIIEELNSHNQIILGRFDSSDLLAKGLKVDLETLLNNQLTNLSQTVDNLSASIMNREQNLENTNKDYLTKWEEIKQSLELTQDVLMNELPKILSVEAKSVTSDNVKKLKFIDLKLHEVETNLGSNIQGLNQVLISIDDKVKHVNQEIIDKISRIDESIHQEEPISEEIQLNNLKLEELSSKVSLLTQLIENINLIPAKAGKDSTEKLDKQKKHEEKIVDSKNGLTLVNHYNYDVLSKSVMFKDNVKIYEAEYKNEALVCSRNFEKGKKTIETKYYVSGQIKERIEYKNGKKNKTSKFNGKGMRIN